VRQFSSNKNLIAIIFSIVFLSTGFGERRLISQRDSADLVLLSYW
jgi:hypothetical protein